MSVMAGLTRLLRRGLWQRVPGVWRASSASASATTPAVGCASDGAASDAFRALEGIERDDYFNVPAGVARKIGAGLHRRADHPLGIIKGIITGFFSPGVTYRNLAGETVTTPRFAQFDALSPIVSTRANFDDVLVPESHVSRRPTETYYINRQTLLRTHTSAHQVQLLRDGHEAFLVTGDVYRRDSIDASHYPVFHQMEGLRVLPEPCSKQDAGHELRTLLEQMMRHLLGDGMGEVRWIDAEFPFTGPSWEMEVMYRGKWLEVLGCGVVQPRVLANARPALASRSAWAFGLGLERLAMLLFNIPDIRLFWSTDSRFTSQFAAGRVAPFRPFSTMPGCFKDVSLWTGPNFHYNNLCEVVRGIAGDLVESVELIDEFRHPKTNRTSQCYRIMYRAWDRVLTNEEIDALQALVRREISARLDAELR